jgi:outer membrane protein
MVIVRRALLAICLVVVTLGTASAEPRNLSFQDALQLAIEHNADLYVTRSDTDIAADDLNTASAIFDPHLVFNAHYGHERELGGPVRFAWTDSSVVGSAEIRGLTGIGTTYSVGVAENYDKYLSEFATIYAPAYTTSLNLVVTQPLLRNAGSATNHAAIVVSSLRRDLSEQQLRVKLETIIGEVETAYWTLALANNEVAARESSLKIAKEQISDSQRLVKIGTISDLDLVEAQAGVDREQQTLLQAKQQVIEAEGRLRILIIGAPSWKPDDTLVATDDPAVANVSMSLDEHLALARKNRPDVLAAVAQVNAETAALGITSNDARPQLDLIVSGSLIGFAGQLDETSGVTDGSTGFTGDPKAMGSFGTALGNLAAGDYTVSVGLRLDLPLSNDAAKARDQRQRHTLQRAQLAQQSVAQRLDNEVRTTVALLVSNEALQRSADATVKTNEKLLAGMRKRFAVGAVTSYDVLRVADELTRSQIGAARARVSYRISLARLAAADGTLLDKYKVTLASLRAR